MDKKKLADIEKIFSEYCAGGLPEDLSRDIRSWTCDNAEMEEVKEIFRRLFDHAGEARLSTHKIEKMYKEFCSRSGIPYKGKSRANQNIDKQQKRQRKSSIRFFRVAAIMIPAAAIFGLGILLFNRGAIKTEQVLAEMTTVSISAGNQRYFTLPDNTEVWVNSNSDLKFNGENFMNERTVILTGEAFFSVAKDALHPFRVITDNLTVEVLGTEFNVKASDGSEITEVALASGSVEVKTANNHTMKLEPNQLFTYNSSNGMTLVEEKSIEEFLKWRGASLRLYNMPLYEALESIGKYFDKEIRIDPEVDPEIRVTLDVGDNRLAEILESLRTVTGGFDYEIEGTSIAISPPNQ